jgi:uncharacterized protein
MKYVLLLLVLWAAYALWRHQRRQAMRDQRPPPAAAPPPNLGATQQAAPPADPQHMVRCQHCGVHLPQPDAVRGQLGWYCGTAHRQLAEGTPPPPPAAP